MTTTGAEPTNTPAPTATPAAGAPTTPPASAAALATVPPAAARPPATPPEPKNAQAIRSLEADKQAAELPPAPSTTMNAFASGYAFETAQRMANALASSSVVPKAYQGNAANCLIAMEVANRVSMSVIAVMQNLDIVHGNPSWRSKFLIAMTNSSRKFSRLKWQWFGTEGKDDWGARAYATDLTDGERLVGPLVTIAIAKAEGWYDRTGTKWKTIPELMLMYRAAGWWTRVYDPEDSMGFGTVEEAEDVHGVEFDRKIGDPSMRVAPGMENANQGRRMSLRPSTASAATPGPVIVDAEISEGSAGASAGGGAPAPSTQQAAATETAKPSAPAGEQLPLGGGDTQAEDKGDAPTAEELAAGDPAPRWKGRG